MRSADQRLFVWQSDGLEASLNSVAVSWPGLLDMVVFLLVFTVKRVFVSPRERYKNAQERFSG